MLKDMDRITRYYLGEDADRISSQVLSHLATQLDNAGHTYCSFWSFVLGKFERYKVVHKNFLLSNKIWLLFIEDRRKKKDELKIRCGLEIKKFQNESRLLGFEQVVSDNNIRVMPIIKYTMGLCIGVPVDCCNKHKEAAIQQLREEPLLFDMLTKVSVFFPITREEVMRNG